MSTSRLARDNERWWDGFRNPALRIYPDEAASVELRNEARRDSCHRRRARRLRGRVANRHARLAHSAARDAPDALDRCPQDRRPRRARLLELVSLRRRRTQCGWAAARGDAPARLADHA